MRESLTTGTVDPIVQSSEGVQKEGIELCRNFAVGIETRIARIEPAAERIEVLTAGCDNG